MQFSRAVRYWLVLHSGAFWANSIKPFSRKSWKTVILTTFFLLTRASSLFTPYPCLTPCKTSIHLEDLWLRLDFLIGRVLDSLSSWILERLICRLLNSSTARIIELRAIKGTPLSFPWRRFLLLTSEAQEMFARSWTVRHFEWFW